MKSTILEFEGFPLTLVRLDSEMCRHLDRTVMIAESLLDPQGPFLLSLAGSGRFLDLFKQGTARLSGFARSKGLRVAVEGHRLLDCLAVVEGISRFCQLLPDDQRSVRVTLDWVAAILPCTVPPRNLPPWEKVPLLKPVDPRTRGIYEQIGCTDIRGKVPYLPKMN
ncbi:MAG TPA: hypothetical protein VGC39_01550, partial [Candidatus Methylacidiphilales bacterium]